MRIVIVGNGVAGISCAMAARQRNPAATITVIGGESDYFFSRTALMYAYMNRMTRRDMEPYERRVYGDQRLALVHDWVTDLDPAKHTVSLSDGATLPYDKLVLAVGAKPRPLTCEGVDQVSDGLVNFVSMQDLDTCERLTPGTTDGVVVGGGLIGIELAECFRFHGMTTTFLVRAPWYWPVALCAEESAFVVEAMQRHGVNVRLGDELARVQMDDRGRVSGVETTQGESIPCGLLGIAIGVVPNTDRIKAFSAAPEIGRGIVVNEYLETSLPDVYACGDCAEIHLPDRQPFVELIWYSAKRQGLLVGRNLFANRAAYRPPIFFNSAKLFDTEYTTVGDLNVLPEGTPTRFRKMPGRPISQRIVHDGNRVLGFSMLGSRWDHEVLERWVLDHRPLDFVLAHLGDAQFDVEFGRAALDRMEEQDLPLRPKEVSG